MKGIRKKLLYGDCKPRESALGLWESSESLSADCPLAPAFGGEG